MNANRRPFPISFVVQNFKKRVDKDNAQCTEKAIIEFCWLPIRNQNQLNIENRGSHQFCNPLIKTRRIFRRRRKWIFELSAEQKDIRQAAREFALGRIEGYGGGL